jgi:stage V sporulation protein B
MNKAKVAMHNTIIGAALKIALIFLLGSHPALSVDGVVIAINSSIVVVTLLHLLSIIKWVPIKINLAYLARFLCMAVLVSLTTLYVSDMYQQSVWEQLVYTTLGCFAVYVICTFAFWLLNKEDLSQLPFISKILR